MLLVLSLLGFLLVFADYGGSTAVDKVTVYPQNCTEKRRDSNVTLNGLLNGTVASNTYYQLLDGIHCIANFSYVENLHNVTFTGDSINPQLVIVTCVANTGLGFINMSLLKLEGMTINDCGISGQNNFDLFQSKLKDNSTFFYELHSIDMIAILVGLVSNFTLHRVTVSSTKGLGMLVVNPQGTTSLNHCTFSSNHPLACYRLPLDNTASINTTDESNHIGGGVYFVFVNFNESTDNKATSLQIQNSTFINNSYCGFGALVAVTYKVEHIVSDVDYSLGAGGGLSIILAQTQYSVNVTVDSTLFRNNTSYFGGGAYIGMFEGISGNQITFINSDFIKNGLEGDLLNIPQLYTSGSGLYIVKDLVFPTNEYYSLTSNFLSNLIHLKNCVMTGNRASYSAAINIYSIYGLPDYDQVIIDNCVLSENEAIVGAAMYVGELKQNGLQPGIQIILNDVTVTKNRIIFEDLTENIATISKSESSAAIELQSVNITFSGNNSLISDNYATAIRSQSSVIYIHDHMVICNNSGAFGGGLNLIAASYVVLRNNSHLRLENNTGAVEGGAIYVNLLAYSPDFNYRDCFLFFREVEAICFGPKSCSNVSLLNFMFELIDNISPLGSLIYGSTLDTCPWSLQLKDMFNKPTAYPVLDIMYEMKDKFNFSSSPTNVNAVTTPSNKLVVHNMTSERSYAPGELFYLNVTAYDHLGQSTPVLLSSKPSTNNNKISSSLGFSNFSFLDGDSDGDTVPVIVTGGENISNVEIYLYATDSYSQIPFQVNLTNCSLGFKYSDGRCQCEEAIKKHSDFDCNSTSMTLSIPNNHWAGPSPDNSLIITPCISDFCSIGERYVKPPNFSSLCHNGYMRDGILCGRCVEGYSMTLGSHHCKKCGNHFITLIIFFAVAGVLIMCGILFLRITVSDGYLNSILFYTNILSIYIPVLSSTSQNATIFVIVAWLNLDYGIESCFYDGMTTLTHVALRLVFPFYLVLLMLLIILISKKSKLLSRIFSRAQFSAAKMFATILLMSYATLLEVCLELMSAVVLRSIDDQVYVMWRSDPNQVYLSGLHIPLMILACVLLVVVILPSPIILMFPKIAFSTQIGVRLKPILDAFWAPFKTKYRFFVGLRLLLRMIPYSVAYLIEQPMNILLLGMFSITMLFFQVVIQPFDGFLHNTLDGFFLANVVMIVMGALYFQIYITAHQENKGYVKYHHEQFIYFTLFVTMAYVAFLLVFLWHIQRRFPSIPRTFTSLLSKMKARKSHKDMIDITETTPILHNGEGDNTSLNDGDVFPPWPVTTSGRQTTQSSNNTSRHEDGGTPPPPPPVNYYILREPLLEEGVADLVPVTS